MRRVVIPYKQHLQKYARQLRSNMTLAEVLLWNELKRKKMLGYDFDRQRSIDEYIVDFFCKDLSLAIEVDGCSHNFNEEQDRRRQEKLEKMGVSVLRFWEQDVKNNRIIVVKMIVDWIRKYERTHPPLRGPLPRGE